MTAIRKARTTTAGQSALDSSRWDRAVDDFDRVIQMKGARADAALYWKAYAQNKLGQRPEALNTIQRSDQGFPKSRYLRDAKALEVEVRRDTGSPVDPEAESDEELKLMALNALQNSDPEQAVPMLQKIAAGHRLAEGSRRARCSSSRRATPPRRATSWSASPRATATPTCRCARSGTSASTAARRAAPLSADIYASSSDVDLKKRILQLVHDRRRKEPRCSPPRRASRTPSCAPKPCGSSASWARTTSCGRSTRRNRRVDVKKQIIRAMFVGGDVDALIELAQGEQNPELRLLAVRNLGLMGSKRTGDTLVEIYGTDKDPGGEESGHQRALHPAATPRRSSPSRARSRIRR